MTQAEPDRRPRPATGAPPAVSGTLATLSADALRGNLRLARLALEPADPLAADAWGHGAGWVTSVLSEAGVAASDAVALSGNDLYGLPGSIEGARPVLRLEGRVLSTKRLREGEGVSYGYHFRASEDTRIALVSGGYAQGIVRALGGRAVVVVNGTRCRVIGRVAMDVCVIDIHDLDVERGTRAVYFGDPGHGEPSLGEWVHASAFTAAELVTGVGLHARREYA